MLKYDDFPSDWLELARTLQQPLTKENLFPAKEGNVVCCLKLNQRNIDLVVGLFGEYIDGEFLYQILIQVDTQIQLPELMLDHTDEASLFSSFARLLGFGKRPADRINSFDVHADDAGLALISSEVHALLCKLKDFDFFTVKTILSAFSDPRQYDTNINQANLINAIDLVALLAETAINNVKRWEALRQQLNGAFAKETAEPHLQDPILFERGGLHLRLSTEDGIIKINTSATTEPFTSFPMDGFAEVNLPSMHNIKLYSRDAAQTKKRFDAIPASLLPRETLTISADGKNISVLMPSQENVMLVVDFLSSLLPISGPYR